VAPGVVPGVVHSCGSRVESGHWAATIQAERRDADGGRRRDREAAGGVPQLAEELQRRNGVPRFKNGAEMLQAWRDLFDSDEEMEEFGEFLQQVREEDRARYRD
jgi:hypothetical protein